MEVLELVEHLESIGYLMVMEGDQLRIKRGKHLPPHLKEKIRQNKFLIIDMLERDEAARKSGFLTGIRGRLYFRSISKQRTVYIERIDDMWEAWRETYQLGRKEAVSLKIICKDESFYYVLQKVNDYIKYI